MHHFSKSVWFFLIYAILSIIAAVIDVILRVPVIVGIPGVVVWLTVTWQLYLEGMIASAAIWLFLAWQQIENEK